MSPLQCLYAKVNEVLLVNVNIDLIIHGKEAMYSYTSKQPQNESSSTPMKTLTQLL